jgi:hypothetical protein
VITPALFAFRGLRVLAPVRYRKRPPEITAVLVTGDNATDVAAWCGGHVDRDGRSVRVVVHQSVIPVRVGDYVIRDQDHTGRVSYYPMRGDILAHCYEPLD